MPGLVMSMEVAAGEQVKERTGALFIVEAMKMQNIIRAERDGVIRQVSAAAGDSVAADDVMADLPSIMGEDGQPCTPEAIDWRDLFASATGRAARAPFLVRHGADLPVAIAYEAAAGPTLRLLTFWLSTPPSRRATA